MTARTQPLVTQIGDEFERLLRTVGSNVSLAWLTAPLTVTQDFTFDTQEVPLPLLVVEVAREGDVEEFGGYHRTNLDVDVRGAVEGVRAQQARERVWQLAADVRAAVMLNPSFLSAIVDTRVSWISSEVTVEPSETRSVGKCLMKFRCNYVWTDANP